MRLPSLRIVVAAVSLLWAGCSATPVPEPPAATLDFGRIHGPDVMPATTVIEIIGDPGAGPPGHVLRVTNLDDVQAPVDAVIAADGSFSLSIAGDQSDELRFHTRVGRTRDLPVDLVWSPAHVVAPNRIDCVDLVPLQQQDFGLSDVGGAPVTRTVALHSSCPDPVRVDAARLRRDGSPFAIATGAPALPANVASGADLGWTLDLSAAQVGDTEEIIFLEITHGEAAARYPVTLFGDGR